MAKLNSFVKKAKNLAAAAKERRNSSSGAMDEDLWHPSQMRLRQDTIRQEEMERLAVPQNSSIDTLVQSQASGELRSLSSEQSSLTSLNSLSAAGPTRNKSTGSSLSSLIIEEERKDEALLPSPTS